MPGQPNSLAFPLALMYLSSVLWALSQFNSGIRLASALASALGESIGKQFGWWDEPYVHHSNVVGIELSVFQCFFLVWYLCARGSILPCFAKQGFAIPTSYIFVLRDTDQTIMTLHEYAVHCCWPLLFCSVSGTSFLPRSTVSLLLSLPWSRPLPQQANPSWLARGTAIHPSRICERLFDWLGFANQVLGFMIGGMDYHQVVYRTPQAICIYLIVSA